MALREVRRASGESWVVISTTALRNVAWSVTYWGGVS
jgi:hypothetical protein